jgi:hypothetical protein
MGIAARMLAPLTPAGQLRRIGHRHDAAALQQIAAHELGVRRSVRILLDQAARNVLVVLGMLVEASPNMLVDVRHESASAV